MSVTVVTGWTGRSYDALGAQFIASFGSFWGGIALRVFVDDPFVAHSLAPEAVSALQECKGLAEFIERYKDNAAAHGRDPMERWKPSEFEAGYSFRFDAVKFATQLFIPESASKRLPDGEIMVWFDADVVTKRSVPEGFIGALIGDADAVYLGRAPKHSEIGFWAVRLSPLTREFLKRIADLYRTDDVFSLRETHSAFVWDHVRKEFEAKGMRSRNLTPGGRGHVWPASPLGRYTEHLKGKRKLQVMSRAA